MKLAFSLAVHKSPGQVIALVRALCRDGNYCVIHCNPLSGPAFREELERGIAAENIGNVRFLASEPVMWGSASILRVEMRAIQALLEWADDWSHHINMSGQCLPTQPFADIRAFLADNREKSFLEMIDPESERPDLAYRYATYYIEVAGKPRNTHIPRPLPRDVKLGFGSFWCILSRDACAHICVSDQALRIRQYLRYTMFPDEFAFQTILMNSPLRSTLVDNSHRLMLWESQESSSPLVLTTSQWDRISDPEILFARKFDPDVDKDVIDRVSQRVGCDFSVKSPIACLI